MSIRYSIGGVLSGYTTCYGDLWKYVKEFDYNDFDGIRLYLHPDAVEKDFPDDERTDRYGRILLLEAMDKDYVRDMMRIARHTGFGEYIPRTVDKVVRDGYIDFKPDVPFYIVVAVTGFFRAWDGNHESLHEVYHDLLAKNVEPYVALCASQSVRKTKGYFDTAPMYEVYLAGEHSIIPFSIFNRHGVNTFRTWRDRRTELQSMADEFAQTGRLDYYGRDEWFGADFSGNDVDIDDIFYWDSDYDEGTPPDEWDNICQVMAHLDGEYSNYDCTPVKFDELVEEIKRW